MPVAMKVDNLQKLAQAKDPRSAIQNMVGDLSGFRPCADLVMVGIYIRPEKTSGGIIRPTDNLKEDVFQGKVGLVLKKGPDAHGGSQEFEAGDWIVADVKQAWSIRINGVDCRFIPYERVFMVVDDPESVY